MCNCIFFIIIKIIIEKLSHFSHDFKLILNKSLNEIKFKKKKILRRKIFSIVAKHQKERKKSF